MGKAISRGINKTNADRRNTQALSTYNWDVVRRPTGGRAILHVDELTYSVTAPETEPRVKGGVLESYLRLSQALLEALVLLGLTPETKEKEPAEKPNNTNSVCFEVPSNYEITVNGKKLIGSAQARRKGGLLQHGTLPLFGDLTRIIIALQFNSVEARAQAKARLLTHATTVEQVLGKALTWQEARDAFLQAFENVLNLDLDPGDLSDKEYHRANTLMQEKYAHPSWTKRI